MPALCSVLRSAFAMSILLPAFAAAQVGHLPTSSPFEDVKLGQNLSIMGGWMAMRRDPADVAPQSSLAAALRYDIAVGGPASLYVRYLIAPSERRLLQPANPLASRVIGNPGVTTHQLDGGHDLALTGKKTWHRLIPSINGGAGVVSDFTAEGETAYDVGFRLWQQKKYSEAVASLRAMASSFAGHRRVSWANNLVGRALLDSGQPRAAAEALLANYRNNPKGERAPDSLYYLGQSLFALKQASQACKAYTELQTVYGDSIRADLKAMLPAARSAAGCR